MTSKSKSFAATEAFERAKTSKKIPETNEINLRKSDFSAAECRLIRRALLEWYDQNQRDLPWRDERNPYLVWVSEIMLQQTQAATVIDYYLRWLERFPTIESLARAPLEEVLGMWAGLGYYRRARFLHESAQHVVDALGGRLPESARELKKLKGIGPYTAGAIASIAFAQPEPLVDGNVERVFSRLRALGGDPKSTGNQKLFWALAAELVDPVRPGDFNQGLMELGATICTPHNPQCEVCPLRDFCQAYALGTPTEFPEPTRRARQRSVYLYTAMIARPTLAEDEFLLLKRPQDGIWGGLWEFPSVELVEELGKKIEGAASLEPQLNLEAAKSVTTRQEAVRAQLFAALDLSEDHPRELNQHNQNAALHTLPIAGFTHHFTHLKLHFLPEVWTLPASIHAAAPGEITLSEPPAAPLNTVPGTPRLPRKACWVTLTQAQSMPISAAMRKLIDRLLHARTG